MKKLNFIFLFLISAGIIFFIASLFDLFFPALDIYKIWTIFYILLFALGTALMIRGIILKIDSSMFIAIIIWSCCIIGIITNYTNFGYDVLWPFYILGLFLANIVIRLVFFDRLQGLLAIISLGIFVNSLLFNLNFYNLVWYIVIIVSWVIGSVLVYNAIYNK